MFGEQAKFTKIPYFLKQRNLVRRSKKSRRPEKKDTAGSARQFRARRIAGVRRRLSRRLGEPTFVKACSYQNSQRALRTDEEVSARRGLTLTKS